MSAPSIVYYHAGCPDGTASAWVCRRRYPDATLVGIRAGAPPAAVAKAADYSGKHVLFVDVCPCDLTPILQAAASVRVIDHHETGKRTLDALGEAPSNLRADFDMTRCGCCLAWDLLFPEEAESRPWFLDYVDDRDRWVWALPGSRDVNAALGEDGWLSSPDRVEALYHTGVGAAEFQARGKLINELAERELCDGVAKATEAVMRNGKGQEWRVWLGEIRGKHRSELGSRLAAKPFADGTAPAFSATWAYDFPTDQWWISLRAAAGEGVPSLVDVCATLPNGGGHPKAAGFTIPAGQGLRAYFEPVSGASSGPSPNSRL